MTKAGLLEQSQNPTHAARLYVLMTPHSGWLASLLEVASTREGRHQLMVALREIAAAGGEPDQADDCVRTEHVTKFSVRSGKVSKVR